MPVSSYNIAPGTTAEEQATKRKIALALMKQGMDTSPVQHWTQGAARMLQSALGGYELHQADKEDREERAKGNELLAQALLGGQVPAATSSNPADAISSIESGGKYDALGPVTKTGDRAYGKYQVMGANVPAWTKAHLGQEMDPQTFLQNPQAQDAVFKGQFGQYAQKYGPEGAARAWFAGEGGMNNLNAKDQLGTSVAQYGQKFAQAMGPQAQRPGMNTQAVVQMLGNRHTAPIAQNLVGALIQQQFKPQDYDIHHTPDGRVIATNKKNPQDMRVISSPGSDQTAIDFNAKKAAAEKRATLEAEKAVAKPEQEKQQHEAANIVVQDIDRAMDIVLKYPERTTELLGSALSNVPGTYAHNVSKLLETVRANAGFDQLNKMRQASPTGGALGSVTEKEIAFLQAVIGNLAQSQTKDQLVDNMKRVKNAYLDIIHGPGNGPKREELTFQRAPANIDDLVKKYAR